MKPEDLKEAVAKALADILRPAREHFAAGEAKKALENLETLLK